MHANRDYLTGNLRRNRGKIVVSMRVQVFRSVMLTKRWSLRRYKFWQIRLRYPMSTHWLLSNKLRKRCSCTQNQENMTCVKVLHFIDTAAYRHHHHIKRSTLGDWSSSIKWVSFRWLPLAARQEEEDVSSLLIVITFFLFPLVNYVCFVETETTLVDTHF